MVNLKSAEFCGIGGESACNRQADCPGSDEHPRLWRTEDTCRCPAVARVLLRSRRGIARSGALFQTHHVLCMFSVVVILTFRGYTRLLGERLDTKTGCPWWEVFAELPVPHFPRFTLVRTEYLDLTWGLGLGVGYCCPGLESPLCLLLHQSPWANQ